ncbi:MAG: 4-hydroxy-tetrahydrodipicolinate reductase, partial [Paraburkholderia sp.]|nr:4-hydroxy-tetrahydrodipicolinate reductase [Paraburkholderia sp.]
MKIAIAGASGRMGRMLIETVLNESGATLSGALDRAGAPQLGQDAGAFLGKQTGVLLTDDIDRVFAESDYLIDFTRPEGTLMHLEAAQRHHVKMVIGTTGF